MIDLHCHVLPGIDDGPQTLEQSLAIARAAAAAGVQKIVATPHVSWDHANDSRAIVMLVDEVNARLSAESVPVEVLPGAELALTRVLDLDAQELVALALGGGPWLLVEPPFSPVVAGLESVLLGLVAGGHQVVIAHPERCPAFQREPQALARLVGEGMLCSITAGSLVGRFGRDVTRFAHQLVERELVHDVASDAHDALRRPPGMADEIADAGYAHLTEWLTESVPAAILSGAAIPPRPPDPPPAAPQTGPERPRWWRTRH